MNDVVRASVIIPALNAAGTIGTQLRALAAQDAAFPWEVVIVDNGSTDGTVKVCRSFGARLPALRIVRCHRRGTSAARNAGAAVAAADLLLFCDADDEVAPDWVGAMVGALDAADAAGGAIESERLNPGRPRHLPRHPDHLPVSAGFLPRAISANLGVRRSAFEDVGGFEERYTYASDDTELCWRLQLAGHRLRYAPEAVVHYRYRDSVRGVLRKAYLLGRARAQLFRDYRASGMPRPRPVGVARRWVMLALATAATPFSSRARWWWLENASASAGLVVGSLRYRVWYL
ncbi:glycosyltransferase [Georgenia thermotolerans]|uniref:glycosyltransferase n=1 Tax=Georgenia thermotolerans TaxID=527326 RepID=UPI0014795B0D|nr:glycosyltransferase [Georgenia thermotolerans]